MRFDTPPPPLVVLASSFYDAYDRMTRLHYLQSYHNRMGMLIIILMV